MVSGPPEMQGARGRFEPDSRRVEALESENVHLRALLAEREQELDRFRASSVLDAQIRALADALPVLISYVDADQRYRYNNKAYEAWCARRRGLLYGETIRDVLGETACDALRPLIDAALAGERVSAEVALPYPDGVARYVQLDYVPSRRSDGAIAGFYSLVRDISESKRIELALRESEARFRTMADSAPSPVWVTSERGVEFVNSAFADFAGCAPEELHGLGWAALVHPDDLAVVQASRDAAWAGEAIDTFDARFRRHDGEWRWLHASLKPRFDDAGRRLGFVGMAADITDAKRAEAELRESEARFRARARNRPSP
jgi:PAS domain S-box-containing protein